MDDNHPVLINNQKFEYGDFIQLEDGIGSTNISTNELQVYPNPAKDKIVIELQGQHPGQKNIFSIYNYQGQILLQQSSQEDKTELDISRLEKGIYFLRVITGQTTVTEKFIVE